jgi:hypothetical protein
MRDVLGFHPAYTTEEAFADFARSVAPGPLPRVLPVLVPEGVGRG